MRRIRSFLDKDWAGIILGGCLLASAIAVDKLLDLPTLTLIAYALALVGAGYSVFADAIRGLIRRDLLDEKFLMSVAAIGAMIISEYIEGVAVMLFFLVGEYFEHKAVGRSRRSIKALTSICPDTAVVITDDGESIVDAEDVEVGMLLIIRPGERVAVDCRVIDGSCDLDTSMLTGESAPRPITVGDTVESGTIVLGGVIRCEALRPCEESCASRILELVEEATDRKSVEEKFITKFSRVYTPAVIVAALIMAIVPPCFKLLDWQDALYRALSFLVVSCPGALVISGPMAFFGGIGGAASVGILYKGGNVFSAIARPENFVFDKTGTLTTGKFSIDGVSAVGIDEDMLRRLVASVERMSSHPIAECLACAHPSPSDATDFADMPGLGVSATVDGYRVAVGNGRLMESMSVMVDGEGQGRIHVAVDGKYAGYITLSDSVKPEACQVIADLKALGVKRTYMLTGDKQENAVRVCNEVGIDEYRCDLMPQDKFSALEQIISSSRGSTVYVGDGINDAPSLARADVGISMGKMGTDSAIEASDAVIISDNLTRLTDAVRNARRTVRIAKQNIIFAIGIKLSVIALLSLGYGEMWHAVFADVGVAVLAILNSLRTLAVKRRR